MDATLTGKLLIASPLLSDPNFERTVVFICAHSENGAFGLVLNRPTVDEVSDYLPQWLDIVSAPGVLFTGGPVSPRSAFGLGRVREEDFDEGWMPVTPGIGLVDLEDGLEALASKLIDLRLFSGYAGWSEGQLEDEINREGWFVVPCETADLFDPEPRRLWREVLRRQRGKVAMFAYFPEDPTQN